MSYKKTQEQKDRETAHYLAANCFSINDLKDKIREELKPFNTITPESIHIISGKKQRLQFQVRNDNLTREVDLMITIYKENGKQKVYINNKSFAACVERFKQDDALVDQAVKLITLDDEIEDDVLNALA